MSAPSHCLVILDRPRRPAATARAVRPGVVPAVAQDLPLGHYAFRPRPRLERGEVLTVEQAAELLQVEPDVVRAMAERGDLPARRLGRHWRLSRRAVIDWLGAAPAAAAAPGVAAPPSVPGPARAAR